MKTQLLVRKCLTTALTCFALGAFALPGGSIMGKVTDNAGNPVDGAIVVLNCQGNKLDFITDEKGNYYASNLTPCTYQVIASYQGKTVKLDDVQVGTDEARAIDLKLDIGEGITLGAVVVGAGQNTPPPRKPLIDPLNPTAVTFIKSDVKDLPIQKIVDLPQIMNIPQVGGGYFVRGARDGGLAYYIDGCKITGDPNVPLCGVEMIRTYTGFIPPKYGDTTGGVVVIETRSLFTE